MDTATILQCLPYSPPFRFVDTLDAIDEHGANGTYYFDPELDFYKGHFKTFPVTPGVLLTEVMAQIGVVCLGLYLTGLEGGSLAGSVALTQTNIEFYHPVMPGERVWVTSEKEYFRFGKLKCRVRMNNEKGEVVCDGIIAGMLIADIK